MEKKSISEAYFGYLVGQTREVLEASIQDERQLKALTSVMLDKMYHWWELGGTAHVVAIDNHDGTTQLIEN